MSGRIPVRGSHHGAAAARVPRVVVSFSSLDSKTVDGIDSELAGLGIALGRYERELNPQDRIDAFIESFAAADALLIVLSERYCESDICVAELILASEAPDRVYLMTVASPGYDVPRGAADGILRLFGEDRTTWLSGLVSRWDVASALESVAALLLRQFSSALGIGTPSGRKDLLSFLGFTPASHIDMLEKILAVDALIDRETEFEAFLGFSSASEYCLYYRGRSFALAGYSDLAMAFYGRAMDYSPGFVPAYLVLCDLAVSGVTVDEPALLGMIARFSERVDGLSAHEEALSLHALGLVYLSSAAGESGSSRADVLETAIRLFGGSAELWATSEVKNAEGQACECLGRYNDALVCYLESLRLDCGNHVALNNLALFVHNRLGCLQLAIPLYEKCLKADPTYRLAKENFALAVESRSAERALFLDLSCIAEGCSVSVPISNAALLLDEDIGEEKAVAALYRLALDKNPTGCAPNYNMASFARRSGLGEGVWAECVAVAGLFNWNELVRLEEALHAIGRDPADAIAICDEVMERLGENERWRYLRELASALAGRPATEDNLLPPAGYYPLVDLAARLRISEGDMVGARTLYGEAATAALPERLSCLAPVGETDFSSILWRVERDIRRSSSDRIMRSQVVTVDGDVLDLMRDRVMSLVQDDD